MARVVDRCRRNGVLLGMRGSIPCGKDWRAVKVVGLRIAAGWGMKLSSDIAHDENLLFTK